MKHRKYLVVTDYFTRCAQGFPSKTQTVIAAAKCFIEKFILCYGFSAKIISDLGHNFESEVKGNLCQFEGVKKD